jgi:hypothetical protein
VHDTSVTSSDADRVLAFRLQLAQLHRDLLRRIGDLRAGRLPADDLRLHCEAFCSALTAHHEDEDGGVFPALVRVRPDLAGTVDKLIEDHHLIASIIARVRELTGSAAARDAIDGELAGLTAIMESHFRFEERVVDSAIART